jgi:hypothetical protein
MRLHLRVVTRWRWLRLNRGISILLPPITREAERRMAHRACCQARPGKLHPLPGTAAALITRAARLSALHCGLTGLSSCPGPEPALPGIAGCKRETF